MTAALEAVDAGGRTVPSPAGRPIARFTTGLLDTLVATTDPAPDDDRAARSHDWTRRCGVAAPAPFNRVPAAVRRDLPTRPGPLRWVVGTGGSQVRHYRVRGARSAAAALLGSRSDAALAEWPPLLAGLGRALRDLHRTVPTSTGFDAPRGPDRLRRWLDGRAPELPAARAAALVRDRIGAAAWRRLRARLAALPDAGPSVLCHGLPGLGSVVPAPGSAEPGAADVLVGEDVTLAPAAWDVGCVLAGLMEDRWRGRDPHLAAAAVAAFQDGLGRRLDAADTSAAILRIALHLHDYVAYVAFDPGEIDRYGDLLGGLLTRFPAAGGRGTG